MTTAGEQFVFNRIVEHVNAGNTIYPEINMNEKITLSNSGGNLLIDSAFVLQFYLPALIHIGWLLLIFIDPPHGEGAAVGGILGMILTISLAALVLTFLLFRALLRFLRFQTALVVMIIFNILHSAAWLVPWGIPVTAVRLLIPTILYFAAYCSYRETNDYAPPEETSVTESNEMREAE